MGSEEIVTPEEFRAMWDNVAGALELGRRVEAAHDGDAAAVLVDWFDVDRVDDRLGSLLLEEPGDALAAADHVAASLLPPDADRAVRLRLVNLPGAARVPIRDLRQEHVNKLVALEGIIRKVNEPRPKLVTGLFLCSMCGAVMRVVQEGGVIREPLECSKDEEVYVGEAGCGRPVQKTRFKLLLGESELVDAQKVELQEPPEALKGGAQPAKIVGRLEADLAGANLPGDRVVINGVLRCYTKETSRNPPTTLDWYLDVESVEVKEFAYEEIHIGDEEEEKIKELAANPNIYSIAARSIAPSLWGLRVEKEAILFQLFGGAGKSLPDGTRLRGDIHVLLIGDPGTAKSQLLRYIAQLAPRGVYVSGKGSTAAGLTAAAVRDDSFGEGKWTLEAGALVLADKGHACVDELDKMNEKDRAGLHEAMEQQEVHISKAGITAKLNSRCSITAAGNPKYGRFDAFRSVFEQLNLPATLLSRFDLIYVMEDRPEELKDKEMGAHILRAHRAGAMARRGEVADYQGLAPPIPPDLLRHYIAYAKRSVFPVLSEKAEGVLQLYYSEKRKASAEDRVAITPRYFEGLIRLTEAAARIRLSDVAGVEDARRAVELVDHSLRTASDSQGRIDIDYIETGQPKTRRDSTKAIEDYLRDQPEPVSSLTIAEALGMDDRDVGEILQALQRSGTVYLPKGGWAYVI